MKKLGTLGSTFKNICCIGLEKCEYFPEESEDSIFADSWRDVTDDQSRKNLAIIFFAPRDLDGDPSDPYVTLSESGMDQVNEQDAYLAQQAFANIAILDFCRIKSADPNTVNIMIVGDLIFHWDINDNFIQPTTINTWDKDVKEIIKSYPKSYTKVIYTNWDKSRLSHMDIKVKSIKELPIYEESWVNVPSFQEKYGTQSFLASLIISGVIFIALYLQSNSISYLSEQISQVAQATPKSQNFQLLEAEMNKQRDFMRYRHLFPFITKDIGNAIQRSGMEIASMEISVPDINKPPKHLIVTIRSKPDAYKGWLQEEPISKALLAQSVTMSAIRRPTNGGGLYLEGLVELEPISELIYSFQGAPSKHEAQVGKMQEAQQL